jgi:hypothetical protein
VRCALVTSVRNEGPWLLEWVAYHRLLGFDTIFIASNDNTDGSDTLLERLDRCGVIRHIDNSGVASDASPQMTAYRRIVDDERFQEHDWVFLEDADEFLVLHRHATVQDFLRDHGVTDGVAVNYLMFGSGGQKARQPGLVIERFKECNPQWRKKAYEITGGKKLSLGYKCFSRISAIRGLRIHRPQFHRESSRIAFLNGQFPEVRQRERTIIDPDFEHYDVAQVNHYVVKSLEEYLLKQDRGAGGQPKSDPRYGRRHTLDFFTLIDQVASGHADHTMESREDACRAEVAALIARCDLGGILARIDRWYAETTSRLRASPPVLAQADGPTGRRK